MPSRQAVRSARSTMPTGGTALGDPGRDQLRVRVRRDLLLLPCERLHVADQRLRSDRALRLPPDRHLGSRHAPPGARGSRVAPVEDVVLPVADVPVDSRNGGCARRHDHYPRPASPADSQPHQPRRDPGSLPAPPLVRTAGEVTYRDNQGACVGNLLNGDAGDRGLHESRDAGVLAGSRRPRDRRLRRCRSVSGLRPRPNYGPSRRQRGARVPQLARVLQEDDVDVNNALDYLTGGYRPGACGGYTGMN